MLTVLTLKENCVISFMGDSTTDCGRNYDDLTDLGNSYAKKLQAYFDTFYAGINVKAINKGISGNRVRDLKQRWDADCLRFKPDIVSILIGINDTWRQFDSNDPTSVEAFERDYHEILTKTKATGAKIVIMEPFVFPYPEDRLGWRVDLDPKIHAVRALAREFQATYIPLDGIFASLITQKDSCCYAADGVHPTDEGHTVIARAWLRATGL